MWMNLQIIIIFSFAAGLLPSVIGALCMLAVRAKGQYISCSLEFSGGVMLTVLFCEALPSAFSASDFTTVMLAVSGGILLVALVQECSMNKSNEAVLLFNCCQHNLTEGLMLGTGFHISSSLGIFLFLSMLVRNCPEIIALTLSLEKSGMRKAIIIVLDVVCGLFFGFGVCFGLAVGGTDDRILGGIFALCAGEMLYTVIGESLPRSHRLFQGRRTGFFCIAGVLCGLFLINIM